MALDIIGPANAPNSTTARPTDDRSFGTTDSWFKDCSSAVANDGTKIKASWLNSVAAFARSLIRANGNTGLGVAIVAEDNADDAMALKSIQHLVQRGQMNFAIASGSVDVLVASTTPQMAEYKRGTHLSLFCPGSNLTATPTLNVNGLGAVTILKKSGQAVVPGDISGNVNLFYDGTNWRINELAKSSAGRLIGIQTFTSSGTYTPTPGMTFCVVEGVGGGGGGSGAATNSAGNVSIGSPGSAGAWAKAMFTAAQIGTSKPVTIGAGGAGAGIAGGATSLGSLLSIPGGVGGSALNNVAPPTFNGAGAIAAAPTGANIASSRGIAPGYSIAISATSAFGGAGGSGPFGTGGGVAANTTGISGTGNGAGGSGSATLGAVAAVTGGAGSGGLIFILEYGE